MLADRCARPSFVLCGSCTLAFATLGILMQEGTLLLMPQIYAIVFPYDPKSVVSHQEPTKGVPLHAMAGVFTSPVLQRNVSPTITNRVTNLQGRTCAITYLLTDTFLEVRMKQLQRSVSLLVRNYLLKYNRRNDTIIIFYTSDLVGHKLYVFRNQWRHLKLVSLRESKLPVFTLPKWFDARWYGTQEWGWCDGRQWSDEYLLMGYVRLYWMWLLPDMQELDFHLTLDTDSYFEQPVPFDIFRRLDEERLDYAVAGCNLARAVYCIDGFRDFIQQHISSHNITPVHLDILDQRAEYTGNFVIARTSFFRTGHYLEFARSMLESRLFWTRRWGEMHALSVALALFTTIDRVGWWTELTKTGVYVHKSASLGSKTNRKHTWKGIRYAPADIGCPDKFACNCNPAPIIPYSVKLNVSQLPVRGET